MNCSFNLSLRHWLAMWIFLMLRDSLVIARMSEHPAEMSPCSRLGDEKPLWFFSGSSGESFTDQSPPGDFSKYSEAMSSACLVQGTRMSSFIPLCAVPSHQHATQLLFHTYTHTPKCSSTHKVGGTFFSSCALQQCFRISDLQLSPTPVCPGPLDLSWSWL